MRDRILTVAAALLLIAGTAATVSAGRFFHRSSSCDGGYTSSCYVSAPSACYSSCSSSCGPWQECSSSYACGASGCSSSGCHSSSCQGATCQGGSCSGSSCEAAIILHDESDESGFEIHEPQGDDQGEVPSASPSDVDAPPSPMPTSAALAPAKKFAPRFTLAARDEAGAQDFSVRLASTRASGEER